MYARDLETFLGKEALALVEDADFMLAFNFVSLARHHNYFASMDGYMKELARITMNMK